MFLHIQLLSLSLSQNLTPRCRFRPLTHASVYTPCKIRCLEGDKDGVGKKLTLSLGALSQIPNIVVIGYHATTNAQTRHGESFCFPICLHTCFAWVTIAHLPHLSCSTPSHSYTIHELWLHDQQSVCTPNNHSLNLLKFFNAAIDQRKKYASTVTVSNNT